CGHPARDHIRATTTIETMKTLNGNRDPTVRAFNRAQPIQFDFGRFGITVKADDHGQVRSRRIHQIAAVRDSFDAPFAESHRAHYVMDSEIYNSDWFALD